MAKQQAPVAKNDYYDVTFTDLTHDGLGVAKVDGFPLFVKNALPGERAKVKVIKVKKGTGTAASSSCTNRARTASSRPVPFIANAVAVSCNI